MSIDIDRATFDRWLAAGTWVEFADEGRWHHEAMPNVTAPGPPADWEADQKCSTCNGRGWHLGGGRLTNQQVPCPDCDGTGLRRLPVTVPCHHKYINEATGRCVWDGKDCHDGRITVAWATVAWVGPVVAQHDPEPPAPYVVVLPIGVWLVEATGTERLTLPPDIDPQSLVGQWARGGDFK